MPSQLSTSQSGPGASLPPPYEPRDSFRPRLTQRVDDADSDSDSDSDSDDSNDGRDRFTISVNASESVSGSYNTVPSPYILQSGATQLAQQVASAVGKMRDAGNRKSKNKITIHMKLECGINIVGDHNAVRMIGASSGVHGVAARGPHQAAQTRPAPPQAPADQASQTEETATVTARKRSADEVGTENDSDKQRAID